tara:strand:+ start:134 stop:574 length:441 start_codon:yes stop_codon:yes gene_type:complete
MNEVEIFLTHTFETKINKTNLKKFCKNVFILNKFFEYKVSIIFVEKTYLRKMKKDYFKKDLFTDVIAFNLNDKNESIDGEIYLSIEVIKDNAKIYGVEIEEEIKRVLSHGILHLIGYDDDTTEKKNQMTFLENESLKSLKDINITC